MKTYKDTDINLENVYNNLVDLILNMKNVPSELLELEQDISDELEIEEERPNECNRLIERAYDLFSKYIV